MSRVLSGFLGLGAFTVLGLGTPSAMASLDVGQVSKTSGVFQCADQSTVVGGGTMSSVTQARNGKTSGTVRFVAENGQVRVYRESYVVQDNGAGGEYVGALVTEGGPLYVNWLYIVGTASYSPGGYLASYSGTAVDICAALGYPST
jgi:hypothetical protein